MTILSVLVGWAAPNLVSILFYWFNLRVIIVVCLFLDHLKVLSYRGTKTDCIYLDKMFSMDTYNRFYLTLVWPHYPFSLISSLIDFRAIMQISRSWAHHITTFLFFGFGLWSLKEAIFGEG